MKYGVTFPLGWELGRIYCLQFLLIVRDSCHWHVMSMALSGGKGDLPLILVCFWFMVSKARDSDQISPPFLQVIAWAVDPYMRSVCKYTWRPWQILSYAVRRLLYVRCISLYPDESLLPQSQPWPCHAHSVEPTISLTTTTVEECATPPLPTASLAPAKPKCGSISSIAQMWRIPTPGVGAIPHLIPIITHRHLPSLPSRGGFGLSSRLAGGIRSLSLRPLGRRWFLFKRGALQMLRELATLFFCSSISLLTT